ncbi:FadR/GntR family transcriptional regulator [Actinotalea sp. K2]|uniref:FadR/GntR family transcriptional regulator n=1 Tax=Actinotalea sp. K2 TaxID=2939438 RepID=UPI00201823E9|nr:FadR/GntR family transcriptional regulator [Actinotalea sp. K2]MCL3859828.1 FadR family transcriptional regulator [Actinotalea sp. K2]
MDVIEHLEHVIFSDGLEAGDSLPSEAELAAELGVSRLTVREGVRALQARGLIEVAHGRRPVIAPPNARPLADFFSAAVRRDARGLLELVEVRLAVEVHTAQLAARNATRADLLSLNAALEAMRSAGDDEAAFNDADLRFHAAIATASGNRMLNFLIEGMEGPLHSSRMHSTRGYLARSGALDTLFAAHQDIYERIAAHDASGAATCMKKHLVATRNDLRTSFELPS